MAKNKNDKAILSLKEQIKKKKAALDAAKKFNPVTNCSLELNVGERYNLHTLLPDAIVPLIVRVNALKLSAESLGLADQFKISGYTMEDWMTDLNTKLTIANRKQEEIRLKSLEIKLHTLLSLDTKVELELEELASQI